MSVIELVILAVGLAMDAFAVAICKGLSCERVKPAHAVITGLYFGGAQALMPLLGYLLGTRFESFITELDHWIAFVLLGILGVRMIMGSRDTETSADPSFSFKAMFPMAIATSIDALAVGITFAFLRVDIVPAVTSIGVITFVLAGLGVYLGRVLGAKNRSRAQILGGVVLILMGVKILLEHLGVF